MKRLAVISDLHCGHRAGLTPPDWGYKDNSRSQELVKFAHEQRFMWEWYLQQATFFQPVDVLLVNGDSIDGKGDKSGGTEQLWVDINVQTEMAVECINQWHADKIVMTYGTPYHTGKADDWEKQVARDVGAVKIGGHEWIEIEGVVFDAKHKTSRSVIPHGRYTGPARDALWNMIWAERDVEPRANVYIRSHVHYYSGSFDGRQMVMTTPALQGFGSKFGTRQCTGTVDVGLVVFDIEGGKYRWETPLLDLRLLAPSVLHL